MRRIFVRPAPTQEGENYDEKSAHWFELFVDLVFVGAAANLADTFSESTSWEGLWAFVVLFFIFAHVWRHYMLVANRYSDVDTLFHSYVFLFIYLLGVALMSVNATAFKYSFQLCAGFVIVNASIVLICLWVILWSPRARKFQSIELVALHCPLLALAVAAMIIDDMRVYQATLTIIAAWSEMYPLTWVSILHVLKWRMKGIWSHVKNYSIKLNIDHVGDRQNDYLMLMLGEAMVSILVDYHSVQGLDNSTKLLSAMGLCLALIFNLGLLIYHLQPTREGHALRRAFITAFFYFLFNTVLACGLLLVSVGIKHVIRAVAQGRPMSKTAVCVLFGGETVVLLMLFGLRFLHFYRIDRMWDFRTMGMTALCVSHMWWGLVTIAPIFPVLGGAVLLYTTKNPFTVVAVAIAIVVMVVLIEAVFADIIRRTKLGKEEEKKERSTLVVQNIDDDGVD